MRNLLELTLRVDIGCVIELIYRYEKQVFICYRRIIEYQLELTLFIGTDLII